MSKKHFTFKRLEKWMCLGFAIPEVSQCCLKVCTSKRKYKRDLRLFPPKRSRLRGVDEITLHKIAIKCTPSTLPSWVSVPGGTERYQAPVLHWTPWLHFQQIHRLYQVDRAWYPSHCGFLPWAWLYPSHCVTVWPKAWQITSDRSDIGEAQQGLQNGTELQIRADHAIYLQKRLLFIICHPLFFRGSLLSSFLGKLWQRLTDLSVEPRVRGYSVFFSA